MSNQQIEDKSKKKIVPVLPSYGNQSIDLHSKPFDWFLYEAILPLNGLILHKFFQRERINMWCCVLDSYVESRLIMFWLDLGYNWFSMPRFWEDDLGIDISTSLETNLMSFSWFPDALQTEFQTKSVVLRFC